jgi:signal transduction histidine kinase
MKILVAEDSRLYRQALQTTLAGWGYEVVAVGSGTEAWQLLQQPQAPALALIDWMMPGLDGIELVRRVRALKRGTQPYIIILTAKGGTDNVVTALKAGADDYVSKPFDLQELQARLQVGLRIAGLQAALVDRVAALETALSEAQRVEALGRLAGGVAHDFNNLLTVVNGYSDLLLHGDLDPARERNALEVIKEVVERGAGLTHQLLAFARKQVLNPVVLDLNDSVRHLDRLVRPLLGATIRLAMELEPDLHPVRAEARQLEQVLLNLLINARDAMPDGGSVTVSTANLDVGGDGAGRAEVPPGSYAVLTVTDTGTGMDEATRARVFEPFFTTKGPGKGTGLGLATVYGIVRQSGGYVEVESAVGSGSAFRIYLPRAGQAVSPAASVPPPPEAPGGATVLLAEDEDKVRLLLHSILTRHGYAVLQAADGAEALRLAAKHHGPIHLLLTDLVMPEMSGRELAARLLPQRPEMKVLYLSGYTDGVGLPPSADGGAVAFLAKPFGPNALLTRVGEVLGRVELASA